ncbi:MAG: hypothetical protein IPI66_10500 [Chitinophagaceae bacterium]|nr:hypothetical protein [Chitinophagaceae bacterium]MBL0055304.1 hypothetical protein [Chitinophagaceae bacterium]
MKKTFLLILINLFAVNLFAQLKIDLVMSSTPPAQLSEWGNRREVLTLIVTSQPGLNIDYKIKAEIKTTDGTVIGTSDLATVPVFRNSSSATIFTATDVLPLDKMIFTGKYKNSLQRTGKLPSDNYSLCVQLVRPIDYTPASEVKCKTFYLASTQLPILMKPYNEEVLDAKQAQTAITFRWTALLPRTTTPVSYRVQVFEVLENQTPVQALRSNMPLLDQEVKATTQYIWRPQISFIWIQPGDLDGDGTFDPVGKMKKSETGAENNKTANPKYPGKPFIWTVQTLDDHGLPVTQTDGSGEARSEPVVFFVKDRAKVKDEKN